MKGEKQVDSRTNYTYLQYLADKKECGKEMGILLESFRKKYNISIHDLDAELAPTFGDNPIIESIIIIVT